MSGRRSRPSYEGDPTLAKVMRQPKWIGALLLALLVAGGFAWLGQWQLSHAISLNNENAANTETVRPLAEVTGPGKPVTDETAGHVFSVSGELVPGDFLVIEKRLHDGTEGAWLVGHLATTEPTPGHLAVALGWAPTPAAALQASDLVAARYAGEQLQLEGRYMPGDAPAVPRVSEDPAALQSMSPAQLVNLWQPYDGPAYAGFLVMHPGAELNQDTLAGAGLAVIESVPPLPVETINWLNLFYAAEWVVFAGFAIFFWFRLVRDDWEKIHELRLLAEAEHNSAQE